MTQEGRDIDTAGNGMRTDTPTSLLLCRRERMVQGKRGLFLGCSKRLWPGGFFGLRGVSECFLSANMRSLGGIWAENYGNSTKKLLSPAGLTIIIGSLAIKIKSCQSKSLS